ncbi:hypothetical protein Scep_007063 [Stephania cephalantha]|uniref:Methionyl-tRNA formyltransferase, mitochondrial n=1 Tax=Stephania cephalantha TaxID=152367 RepID=A0AAP0K9C0_9MAGN
MQSALAIRRFYCCCCSNGGGGRGGASSSSSALSSAAQKKQRQHQLVFMGSPQISASVLDALLNTSKHADSIFQVAAIVTQPPSERARGRKVMPSPVAQHALDRGFSPDLIFTPEKAGEEIFLANLKTLQPDLCITAAYGNILPTRFLSIPQFGTVNVHPSLLPLYRGAAPVQRALQDGVKETGVSLAYTVRALDAGPVITSEKLRVDDQVKAPGLLSLLFDLGSKLLLRELPSILDGSARIRAQAQDDSQATLAPKIMPDESWLSFDEEAIVLHNKVRAFAGWPGSRAKVCITNPSNGHDSIVDLKIMTTRASNHDSIDHGTRDYVTFVNGALVFPCGGRSALEVLEVQLPGKKVVNATAFWNGLRGRQLKTVSQSVMAHSS